MTRILFVRCDRADTFGVAKGAIEDAGAAVVVWEAFEGQPQPYLDGVAGVVLLGSTFNVEHANEQPFIKLARELTLEALDRGIPYLGVCFGSQLLAWSLDANVMKAPVRELGYEPLHPTTEAHGDPLMAGYADGDRVFQWHMDTFELPEGAVLLATGDDVRNQAYRVGASWWGLQFHLEIDRAELELWLDEFSAHADLGATWGRSPADIRAEADRYQAHHERRGRDVFRRFAGVAAGDRT